MSWKRMLARSRAALASVRSIEEFIAQTDLSTRSGLVISTADAGRPRYILLWILLLRSRHSLALTHSPKVGLANQSADPTPPSVSRFHSPPLAHPLASAQPRQKKYFPPERRTKKGHTYLTTQSCARPTLSPLQTAECVLCRADNTSPGLVCCLRRCCDSPSHSRRQPLLRLPILAVAT